MCSKKARHADKAKPRWADCLCGPQTYAVRCNELRKLWDISVYGIKPGSKKVVLWVEERRCVQYTKSVDYATSRRYPSTPTPTPPPSHGRVRGLRGYEANSVQVPAVAKHCAVDAGTVTVHSHSALAAQADRHTRHCTVDSVFGHNGFGASTFPVWPFTFIVTPPPPLDPGPTGATIRSIPGTNIGPTPN